MKRLRPPVVVMMSVPVFVCEVRFPSGETVVLEPRLAVLVRDLVVAVAPRFGGDTGGGDVA